MATAPIELAHRSNSCPVCKELIPVVDAILVVDGYMIDRETGEVLGSAMMIAHRRCVPWHIRSRRNNRINKLINWSIITVFVGAVVTIIVELIAFAAREAGMLAHYISLLHN